MTILLLDTHVALWAVATPDRLGPATRGAIEAAENAVIVSVASVWEASIKAAQGRLNAPPTLWDEVERGGIDIVAIERRDAVEAASLPLHHRDPFDRMLVAQARERNAVLVTVDDRISRYDVQTWPADH